jgi:hypothetical protein
MIPNASVIPNLFRNLKLNTTKQGMLKQVQHDKVEKISVHGIGYKIASLSCMLRSKNISEAKIVQSTYRVVKWHFQQHLYGGYTLQRTSNDRQSYS